MAQPSPVRRIGPLARGAADHTAAHRWHALFTGHLPRPPGRSPRQAGRRRLARQRRRANAPRGRWNPYGPSTAPHAGTVLALVARVVVTAVRGLLLAALGLPPLLASRGCAARPGPVPVPPVAPAADRKRLLAAPAVARMKDSHLARRHRSLRARRPGQPPPACARLVSCLVLPRPWRAAERHSDPGAH